MLKRKREDRKREFVLTALVYIGTAWLPVQLDCGLLLLLPYISYSQRSVSGFWLNTTATIKLTYSTKQACKWKIETKQGINLLLNFSFLCKMTVSAEDITIKIW